jgi:hypothetical protein
MSGSDILDLWKELIINYHPGFTKVNDRLLTRNPSST